MRERTTFLVQNKNNDNNMSIIKRRGITIPTIISSKHYQPWLLLLTALVGILVVSKLTMLVFITRSDDCSRVITMVAQNSDVSATPVKIPPSFERTATSAAVSKTTTAAEALADSDPISTTTTSSHRIKRPISKLGTCGLPWQQYLQSFSFPANSSTPYNTQHQHYDTTTSATITRVKTDYSLPLVWSVSGGAEYRSYVGDLLHHWYTMEPDVTFLVVALDPETADVVCNLGYNAVYWNIPAQSYSRVADAKLQVTVEWIDRGIDALFIELDVLCRWSPIRLFQEAAQQKNASVVWVGHGKYSLALNIGVYYVQAKNHHHHHATAVRDFFQQVSQVLAPSLHEEVYMKGNGKVVKYFDQDALKFCLRVPINNVTRPRWYRLTDINQTYDLFSVCHPNFTYTALSTMLITNEDPPTPHDSTYCIHPLAGIPFSSFRYKLITAKVLGFDPVDWRPDERFLKTQSGGVENVWMNLRELHNNTRAQRNFKDIIAFLILLSQLSNRTLVLPRHILDEDFNAYPVYGLVDVATIEDLVSWRYLSQLEVHPHRNDTVEISAQDYSSNVTALIEAVQNCGGARFCSIGPFLSSENPYPLYVDSNDTIISKLKWCVEYANLKPSRALGAFEKPCDSWTWDKIGGVYRRRRKRGKVIF